MVLRTSLKHFRPHRLVAGRPWRPKGALAPLADVGSEFSSTTIAVVRLSSRDACTTTSVDVSTFDSSCNSALEVSLGALRTVSDLGTFSVYYSMPERSKSFEIWKPGRTVQRGLKVLASSQKVGR